jgi:dolichyl-phosphate-mannose--protein O-mannosyl transferase
LLVNALAGAFCVFVFWLIVKQLTKNTTYSLLMACLLGISTAHILFSSMLETYIYSALGLIIFVLVIQGENKRVRATG